MKALDLLEGHLYTYSLPNSPPKKVTYKRIFSHGYEFSVEVNDSIVNVINVVLSEFEVEKYISLYIHNEDLQPKKISVVYDCRTVLTDDGFIKMELTTDFVGIAKNLPSIVRCLKSIVDEING